MCLYGLKKLRRLNEGYQGFFRALFQESEQMHKMMPANMESLTKEECSKDHSRDREALDMFQLELDLNGPIFALF